MGYDWNSSGEVPLKPGTTLRQLVDAFNELSGGEWDDAHLLVPGCYNIYDDIDFQVNEAEGWLSYSADANSGWLNGIWESYLDHVAENFASAGWVDYRGDDAEPTFMGPNPAAIRDVTLSHYVTCAEHAIAALKRELATPLAEDA
jgi:hypothetical protein